ncbi:MAG: KilA-N domain-containing protein [Magnetospirillum sp.]|nr:MAG: KilA-N domain-containing protein [Magnetospirillum sp.]
MPIVTRPQGNATIQTVNLRNLHDELGVGRDYATWIKERISRYGFAEGQDFVIEVSPRIGENPLGGRPAVEYHGTIDMAKELAMVENNDRGRQVRRYFIEAERRLRQHQARPEMPYFLRRMVANMNNVPHGHFSILNEIAAMLVGPMEALGYTLPEHLWPDISAGLMFCGWLRKEKGIEPKTFPDYIHVFADGKREPVRARAYPNSLLADVRHHFQYVWLPKKAADYFKGRDPNALLYLPQLLPPPTPAKH